MAQLAVKIAITPKENNQSTYEMLDLVASKGRSYLSLKQNNTASFTDTTSWMKMTENAYDIAVRNGFEGSEAEWLETVGKPENEEIDVRLKAYRLPSSGAITIAPSVEINTFKVDVIDDVLIGFNLLPMIGEIGNARCRLIVDVPTGKTVSFAAPIVWNGDVPPTVTSPGIYVFEIIDIDGLPFIWKVAETHKKVKEGKILYVDGSEADYTTSQINSETATRDSSSWQNPFVYLQNAINAAKGGDAIYVREGVYYPTHLRTSSTTYNDGNCLNRNATFTIKSEVDIYGGFMGEDYPWLREVNEDGMMKNKTILSGDITREIVVNSNTIIGDRSTTSSKENAAYNVVYFASQKNTYLNGVTIMNGNANNATGVTSQGGGVRPSNNFLVLVSCEITNCSARAHGGAIHKGTLIACKVYNNTITGTGSSQGGGGCYQSVVVNSHVYNNRSDNGGGCRECKAYSSLIYNNRHNVNAAFYLGSAYNSLFFNNECSSSEGATLLQASLIGCSVFSNRSDYTYSFGSDVIERLSVVNTLLFKNLKLNSSKASIRTLTALQEIDFYNNAYDTSKNPTLTTLPESEIDFDSCLLGLTILDIKIELLSFTGNATASNISQVEEFAYQIEEKLSPKKNSLLIGKGVDGDKESIPLDYLSKKRLNPSTIGALEGKTTY